MRTRWAVTAIWACFLARLLFYSAMLPLWEGYDEWAHFSVIRIMAGRGEFLVSRQAAIPQDVEASFALAPIPYEMRDMPAPASTQDAFWKLSAEERARREAAFRSMPETWRSQDATGPRRAYEALQPPLYYWLMAPAMKLAWGASLPTQVILLRWLSSLVGSLAIPVFFLVGRSLFRNDALALVCAAVAAVMPEFAIDFARVGNECVAATLFAVLIWATLKVAREGLNYRSALAAGAALGFGLLAKAYFLTAAPVVAAVYIYGWRRSGREGQRSRIGPALCAVFAPILIAGWWYIRNIFTSGTFSGLNEAAATRSESLGDVIAAAVHINYLKVLDGILLSHIYFGGWSSSTVRAWMYHLFYVLIAAAAIGLLWGSQPWLPPPFRRRLDFGQRHVPSPLPAPPVDAAFGWAAAFYLLFLAGQFYQATLLGMSAGFAAAMGWHTYAVASAEIPMATAGLRAILPTRFRSWVAPVGVALFAALDLYTVNGMAIPYYTGIIARKANSALAGLHMSSLPHFAGVFDRLAMFKGPLAGPAVIAALWVVYVGATVAVPVLAIRGRPGQRITATGPHRG